MPPERPLSALLVAPGSRVQGPGFTRPRLSSQANRSTALDTLSCPSRGRAALSVSPTTTSQFIEAASGAGGLRLVIRQHLTCRATIRPDSLPAKAATPFLRFVTNCHVMIHNR